jgi:hypothetical protein
MVRVSGLFGGIMHVNRQCAVFLLITTVFLNGCSTMGGSGVFAADNGRDQAATENRAENKAPPSAGRTALFTGNGGKGIVIAVPAPSMAGGSRTDAWQKLKSVEENKTWTSAVKTDFKRHGHTAADVAGC